MVTHDITPSELLAMDIEDAKKIARIDELFRDMRKFYGEEIEMKNILRNRDIFPL